MRTKNLIRFAAATAGLLLVPLVAMQFTDEVKWTPADFVVAGALLLGSGFVYELVSSRASHPAYRAAVGLAVMGALLLVWVNLAVGIIGNEQNPANLMYAGVLAVGLVGAVAAPFRPQGMARALVAMALAQVTVAVIVKAAALDGTVALDGVFAALWTGSALLFRASDVTAAHSSAGRVGP